MRVDLGHVLARGPQGAKEELTDFKARLKRTALGLSEHEVRKAMGSMKRRAEYVRDNGGAWVKND